MDEETFSIIKGSVLSVALRTLYHLDGCQEVGTSEVSFTVREENPREYVSQAQQAELTLLCGKLSLLNLKALCLPQAPVAGTTSPQNSWGAAMCQALVHRDKLEEALPGKVQL